MFSARFISPPRKRVPLFIFESIMVEVKSLQAVSHGVFDAGASRVRNSPHLQVRDSVVVSLGVPVVHVLPPNQRPPEVQAHHVHVLQQGSVFALANVWVRIHAPKHDVPVLDSGFLAAHPVPVNPEGFDTPATPGARNCPITAEAIARVHEVLDRARTASEGSAHPGIIDREIREGLPVSAHPASDLLGVQSNGSTPRKNRWPVRVRQMMFAVIGGQRGPDLASGDGTPGRPPELTPSLIMSLAPVGRENLAAALRHRTLRHTVLDAGERRSVPVTGGELCSAPCS